MMDSDGGQRAKDSDEGQRDADPDGGQRYSMMRIGIARMPVQTDRLNL